MVFEREETIQLLDTLKEHKSLEIQSSRPIIIQTILLLIIISLIQMKIKLALLLLLQLDLISILITSLFSKIMKSPIRVFKSMYSYILIIYFPQILQQKFAKLNLKLFYGRERLNLITKLNNESNIQSDSIIKHKLEFNSESKQHKQQQFLEITEQLIINSKTLNISWQNASEIFKLLNIKNAIAEFWISR